MTLDRMLLIPNPNAGSVSKRNCRELALWGGRSSRLDVYVPSDLNELQDVANSNLEHAVMAALGGDGTQKEVINAVIRARQKAGIDERRIYTALLRGGRGCGLASEVDARKDWRSDVNLIKNYQGHLRGLPFVEVPLMEIRYGNSEADLAACQPVHFTFKGEGWDGLVINKNKELKDSVKGKFWSRVGEGLLGYFVAGLMAIKEEWKLRHIDRKATFKVNSGRAFSVDDRGVLREIEGDALGDLIDQRKEGAVREVIFGSSRYLGYRMDAFYNTQATRIMEDGPYLETRVIQGELGKLLRGILPAGFRTWSVPQSEHISSYLAKDVTLTVLGGESLPLQIGGDAYGDVSMVNVKISEYKLMVVDYAKLRAA